MATIDTSIYGRVSPGADLSNLGRAFATGQQIRGQQNENRLRDLAIAETTAINEEYQNALNAMTGQVDQSKLYSGLAARGVGSAIPGLQKGFAATQKAQTDADSAQRDANYKMFTWARNGIATAETPDAARQYLMTGIQAGYLTPQMAQIEASNIPDDPAAFAQWRQQTQQGLLTAQQQLDGYYRQQGLNLQQQRLQHDINQSGTTTLQKNLAAAGLRPGTPEYQQAVLDGSRGTTVNVGAGDKAWDTESAKLFAKRYDDISSGAVNAQQMMGMYDLAEQALNSGVRTGLGADAEITLRQFGAAMGMNTDPEKLAGGELVRAVQNRMALLMRSPDGGMGMPGALSDRDIRFLKDSQIGIDRSPEGNRAMLQAFRAMEKRKIEMAQLADQYIQENGRLDAGFNRTLREFAEANPIFDPGQPLTGGTRDSQLDDILGL